MINLTKGNTAQSIIFTGTEQCLLNNPYFLFIFTSRQTNKTVTFIGTNTSTYTTRYDEVIINVVTKFADEQDGLWDYKIYEQVSSSNTDPVGLNEVEEGFMKLLPESEFEPTFYNGQSNIVTTNGE